MCCDHLPWYGLQSICGGRLQDRSVWALVPKDRAEESAAGLGWIMLFSAICYCWCLVRAVGSTGHCCSLLCLDCSLFWDEGSVWVMEESLWLKRSTFESFWPESWMFPLLCCSAEIVSGFSWQAVSYRGVCFFFWEATVSMVLMSSDWTSGVLFWSCPLVANSSCLLGDISFLVPECPAIWFANDSAAFVAAALCSSVLLSAESLLVLSESALWLQTEAIAFTQWCWRICSAVSLTVGSGLSRDLTRPLASVCPQRK